MLKSDIDWTKIQRERKESGVVLLVKQSLVKIGKFVLE